MLQCPFVITLNFGRGVKASELRSVLQPSENIDRVAYSASRSVL